MRLPRVALVLAPLVLTLAACGGGGGGSSRSASGTAGGAEVVPRSVPYLVRVDTSFSSDQWRALQALLARFPDGKDVLSMLGGKGVDFEQDVKPALGPETDIFPLTQADEAKHVFLTLTQPRNAAKLDSLLAKDTSHPVSEEIAGWRVIANTRATIDRLKQARNGGTLADTKNYQEAMDSLPAARVAAFYADGATAARTAANAAKTGTGSGPVPGAGRLGWVAGAIGAEQRGFSLDLRIKGDELQQTPFTAELPAQLPAGASLVVDVKGLDTTLEQLKRSPALQKQLGTAEKSFGALIDRVIALFKGETAFEVRPMAGGKSAVLLVVAVGDETEAQSTIDQVATLLGALTQHSPQPVQIAGIPAQKLLLGKTGALFYAVFDGKLVVSNAESMISGLKTGPRLADSQPWKTAADAAGLPDQTAGIVYADVGKLVPALQSVPRSGKKPTITPTARRNLEELSSAIFYATRDGDVLTVKGFASVR